MSLRLHLITTVGGTAIQVLPHMLRHYRELGISSFFVIVHRRGGDDPVLSEVKAMTDAFGIDIADVVVQPHSAGVQAASWARFKAARPDDWFVVADQDELQWYPAGLVSTLEDCERRGYEYVTGCLVDRLSADGTLAPLRPDAPIWQQYPLGGFLTYPLCGGDPRKVVAVKGRVPLGPGQHSALGGRGCPIQEHFVPVHHFKWIAGLLEYLQERAASRRALGDPCWVESDRFTAYYERRGHVDLDDPNLMVAPCLHQHQAPCPPGCTGHDSPIYPPWPKLRDMATAFREARVKPDAVAWS